jgi:high-affinity Fe2+/Pb2+ permease
MGKQVPKKTRNALIISAVVVAAVAAVLLGVLLTQLGSTTENSKSLVLVLQKYSEAAI